MSEFPFPMRTLPGNKGLRDIPAPALLYVNAKWCPHCKTARPVLQEASCVLGSVVPVYDIDSDQNENVVRELGVNGFPTIIYMDAGRGMDTFKGDRMQQDAVTSFVCHKAACPGDMAKRRGKCRR